MFLDKAVKDAVLAMPLAGCNMGGNIAPIGGAMRLRFPSKTVEQDKPHFRAIYNAP